MKQNNSLSFLPLENMEDILHRLVSLSNLIETICYGLERERIKKQAIDCIICIGYIVKEILYFTEQILNERKTEVII